MSYSLLFQKTDTLNGAITSGATSATLTTGNFGSPSGTQFYVFDYDVPASAEVSSATVVGTAMSAMTRGLDGTTGVAHSSGAKVGAFFVPSHYSDLIPTLGYTSITSDFTSATSGSDVDVTSLTSTVTVPASNRRVKITAFANSIKTSAGATTVLDFKIKEGATVLSSSTQYTSAANSNHVAICMWSGTPTVGSHTYKVSIQQNGVGTMTVSAAATYPAFILVEYI